MRNDLGPVPQKLYLMKVVEYLADLGVLDYDREDNSRWFVI